MTEPGVTWLAPIDDPPTTWIDSHLVLENLTEEEVRQGELLGRMINAEDHNDNGLDGQRTPLAIRTAVSQQQAEAMKLRTSLLDHGVGNVVSPFTGKVGGVSIELQLGANGVWYTDHFVGHLNHHTAGPRSGLTPSLSVVKLGRSDLQGPLCNGYGGRDFFYRLITFGYANHPGLGGPMALGNNVIPRDNGRPYLWGTEFEHDGVTEWADEMVEWMARVNAGVLDYLGVSADCQAEHKDWAPTRKTDRNIITRASSIARTKAVWNSQEEDDVVTDEQLETAAYNAIARYERERHAAGQPTPQEAYQSSDELLKQAQSNGANLSNLKTQLEKLSTTMQAIQKSLDALVAASTPPDQQ